MNKNALFIAKFFLIFTAGYFIILNAPLEPLENWIARVEGQLLGIDVERNVLTVANVPFVISESCTGLVSITILASIVFALRGPELKKKLYIFAFAALTLFHLNLLRVYAVLLAGMRLGPVLAEGIHVASWFAMSGAIIALWYFLTKKATGLKRFYHLL